MVEEGTRGGRASVIGGCLGTSLVGTPPVVSCGPQAFFSVLHPAAGFRSCSVGAERGGGRPREAGPLAGTQAWVAHVSGRVTTGADMRYVFASGVGREISG